MAQNARARWRMSRKFAGVSELFVASFAGANPQHHDLFFLAVGQASQQGAVGDAEERCGERDPECQRERRQDGQPRMAGQRAHGRANVGNDTGS